MKNVLLLLAYAVLILIIAGGSFLIGRDSAMANSRMSVPKQLADKDTVVCSLSPGELTDRQQGVFVKLKSQVVETKTLDNGLALRFAGRDGLVAELAAIIEAERKCCQFLTFKLDVAPNEGPIWLELTGPDGTKEFLQRVLGIDGQWPK